MGAHKYKAFISYSHKDRAWAKWLLKRIESYSFPKHLIGSKTSIGTVPRNLKPVFRDREELSAGHNLGEKIEAALNNSENLIIICSPNAAKSHWVNQEIIHFKRYNRDANILSVIVDGVPYSEDPQLECFPPALKVGIDEAGEETEDPAEPLAADFRTGGDGKRLGTLKLISGMAGLGVNDLIQRDLQRARRRVMTITASAAAIVLAMGGLTLTALDARNEAQQRRNDAEGQIEFMLTDLKDKLKGVGRLDALEIVGERAKEYYDQYPISAHDTDALGRKARVFHYLGELYYQLGNLERAETYFNNAYVITEVQLENFPENPDRIFEHGQSVYWLGYLLWKDGLLEEVRPKFESYLGLATRLNQIEPNSIRGKRELAYAHFNFGVLLGHLDLDYDALRHFEESIPIFNNLYIEYPKDSEAFGALFNALGWRADRLKDKGDLNGCVADRENQLGLIEKSIFDISNNATLQFQKATAIIGLCYCLIEKGEFERAYEVAFEEFKFVQSLSRIDQANHEWLGSLVYLQNILLESSKDYSTLPFSVSELIYNESTLGVEHRIVSLMVQRRKEKSINILEWR